jgi:hypothetical protein
VIEKKRINEERKRRMKNDKKLYSDICDSLDIFYKWASRGFIMGQIKDKYDTTRWYAHLSGGLSLHTLCYPRHYYNRFPKWLNKIDRYVFEPIFKYTGINIVFRKWQYFCYTQAYKEVLTKFPDVQHCINYTEILDQDILLAYRKYREEKKLDLEYEDW